MQSYRQTWTASIIRNYVERDRNFLHPQVDVLGENRWAYIEFPLYEYLLAAPMMIAGYTEALIRIFNIACGLVTVLVLFRLLLEDGLGTEIAAVGAACYAATPVAIFFHRALMMDTFVVMLGAIYLLYLRRWLEEGRTATLVAATVFLSVAVLEKPTAAWPAMVFGASLVGLRKGVSGLLRPRFLICHGIALLPFFGWALFVWLSGYGVLSKSGAGGWFGWRTLLDWSRLWHFTLRITNSFSVCWVLLTLAGAWVEYRRRRAVLIVLAGCGISAFLVFPEPNIVHAHYQLPILFAVAPLTGAGLTALVEAVTERAPSWRYMVLCLCLIGATAWGFDVALHGFFPFEAHHPEAAHELQSIPQNGPQLYYIGGSYFPALHYLARRRGLIIPDGSYPHSPAYDGYNELLVYLPGDEPAPAAIAHGMGSFRKTGTYRYWQLYTRTEK